jgi:2,3,4,5-tetrahydropyridine-2-carboxylate N-succinyltransferase
MNSPVQVDYIASLRSRLENVGGIPERSQESLLLFEELRGALESGVIRVAEPLDDGWVVNVWVRRALLACVQAGMLTMQPGPVPGTDFDTTPWRNALFSGCRIPAGSFIRHGAHLDPGVTVMPGTVIQIGAFVGAGSMIDSHATIGAGAQIGREVNIGCGVVIGGVLLPLDASPNIIEDGVVLGYNCGVFDGVRIGAGSIITAGTTISGLAGIYDAINQAWLRGDGVSPLTIPPGSVITMGIQDTGTDAPTVRTLVPVILDRRS